MSIIFKFIEVFLHFVSIDLFESGSEAFKYINKNIYALVDIDTDTSIHTLTQDRHRLCTHTYFGHS